VSVFHPLLRQPDRALARVDPFSGEPLLQRIDPASDHGHVTWHRVAGFWALMWMPTVVFAIVQPAHGFARLGAGTLGDGGLRSDVDVIGMWGLWACYLTVIVLGRRLVGALLIALEDDDLIERRRQTWTPARRGWLLGWLEAITRLTPRRCIYWWGGLILLNLAANQTAALAVAQDSWRVDPSTPGTLFYWFGTRVHQPNFAGFWHLVVASGTAGYLMLLLSRLYVVFACLSSDIAEDPSLRIIPTHPDGTGGLLAIGQAALFMSLAIFVSGLGLTVIATQAILTKTPVSGYFVVLCAAYLIVGPILFVLPQAPLRRAMLDARRQYLNRIQKVFHAMHARHQEELAAERVESRTLQDKNTVSTLMQRADDMSVWPFDRRTFRRFFGLLVAPVLPALSPIIRDYPIKEIVQAWLGL
jgi:hypothetical protein